MKLNPAAREYAGVRIVTTPAIAADAWEASFDHGLSWYPATVRDGASTWLLAGPLFVGAEVTNQVTVPTSTVALVRATDTPEVLVRKAFAVTVAV